MHAKNASPPRVYHSGINHDEAVGDANGLLGTTNVSRAVPGQGVHDRQRKRYAVPRRGWHYTVGNDRRCGVENVVTIDRPDVVAWGFERAILSGFGSKAAFKISEPVFGALPTSRNKPVGEKRPNSHSAGKPARRRGRGSFFRRRRWRLAARLVDGYPRIAQFHNTLPQPTRKPLRRNIPARASLFLLFNTRSLRGPCRTPPAGLLVRHIHNSRQSCGEFCAPVVVPGGLCHLIAIGKAAFKWLLVVATYMWNSAKRALGQLRV